MKNFKFKSILYLLIVSFATSLFLACSNNDDDNGSTAPPVITSVAASVNPDGSPSDLTPVTQGFANNLYIIRGSGFKTTKKIYFNEKDTYFNPNLVTDTEIFVTVDINTPYANATDQLKVVTEYGTATYGFVIAPPAPVFGSYNPINAAAGSTVTIYGNFFLNPTVRFGSTNATVLSSTLTQIQVQVPAGVNNQYVTVTTISGSSTSTQAVGTAIYDDTAAPFVENYLGPWDGSGFVADTDVKIQGESSIRAVFSGYTGFKFPMYASPVSTAGYSGIRVSFKSTKETGKFKVVINNNYGAGKEISFDSNWKSFVIPFSELGGAPASINEIVFQEFNNDGGDKLYIDDVGFVLN
ncbi:IPT/TIG domain-containing protein [Flavobacterium sp.]|uniref:IPT/TIG domain-containing protein n=1 Tax=Flavobacterium sp. TaxID=239 RepID=UPI00261D5783|nr:IPT/TIG domain-containing protein [Flavobacterium sp.]